MPDANNAIMIADTRPALVGQTLLQIQMTNPGLFQRALIYYMEMSEEDMAAMNSIIPCDFVKYEPDIPSTVLGRERFAAFSPLMFARYELFDYLDEYDTVTWLDTDILIQDDLSPMIELGKLTGIALVREDPSNKTSFSPDTMQTSFKQPIKGYDMQAYLYCSGTIVASNKLEHKDELKEWCYSATIEYADLLIHPDQGVLNLLVQKFELDVTPLCGRDYCCFPAYGRDCSEAAIIHSWGPNKFWNDWYLYSNYPEWGKFFNMWRSEYSGSDLSYDLKPAISVVIPSYKPNIRQFRECLDSLIYQTRRNTKRAGAWERYSDFEILIVSEPFEQKSIEALVASYKDSRLRLIFNDERKGIAASINVGMANSYGRYIARIDDDDIAAPHRLFSQVQFLEEHEDVTLCTSDFEYFGSMNERRTTFDGELSRAWCIFTCPFDHPTIMFRKSFFEKNDLKYDEQRGYVEDWELWERAFNHGMVVGSIHEVLFYHRWINQGAGATSQTIDMMRDMVRKNFSKLNVTISEGLLPYVGPWNGKVPDEIFEKLEYLLKETLASNEKVKLYDQDALEAVFSLRLSEAKTGKLPDSLVKKTVAAGAKKKPSGVKSSKKIRQGIKKCLKPLYRPFRRRYENRIIKIEKQTRSLQPSVNNVSGQVTTLTKLVETSLKSIDVLSQVADNTVKNIGATENSMKEMHIEIDNLKLKVEEQNNKIAVLDDAIEQAHQQRDWIQQLIQDAEEERRNNQFELLKEVRSVTFNARIDKKIEAKNSEKAGASQDKNVIYDDFFYDRNRYGSYVSANHVLKEILPAVGAASIIDFGCGTGTWLYAGKQLGVDDVLGLDGNYINRRYLLIDDNEFLATDLELPYEAPKKYDLAMSMEVAEHLKPESANTFIDSICSAADKVLFSAAHVGQGGENHINERPLEYWCALFEARGYTYIDIRKLFENDSEIEHWYRENIALYIKGGQATQISNLLLGD